MQPVYHKCPFKVAARAENAAVYKKVTGQQSIPADRQYWTLCNLQPQDNGAEIVQMEEVGLLKKSQFFGVDRDGDIVRQNREWHPQAHWYEGEWLKVIEDYDDFNPALVYLDITGFADHRIATDNVVKTMMFCPSKTLLLANVMLNDPRSSRQFDQNALLRNLEVKVPASELSKWTPQVENYIYSATGKTFLMTYVLWKQ
jgi:hypothetical protein